MLKKYFKRHYQIYAPALFLSISSCICGEYEGGYIQDNIISPAALVIQSNGCDEKALKLPRLIIGREKNPFLFDNSRLVELTVGGKKLVIDNKTHAAYYYSNEVTQEAREAASSYANQNGFSISAYITADQLSSSTKLGSFELKEQDITVNLKGNPHIQGDAWNPSVIAKIHKVLAQKNHNKLSAVIIQEVPIPINWGRYLKNYLSVTGNKLYCLNEINPALSTSLRSKEALLEMYARKKHVYHKNAFTFTTVFGIDDLVPNMGASIDPTFATIGYSDPKTLFKSDQELKAAFTKEILERSNQKNDKNSKERQPLSVLKAMVLPMAYLRAKAIKPLKEVLKSADKERVNNILKKYYDLIAPGGTLVYISPPQAIYLAGGIIVEYNGKYYSPFSGLDDPNFKAVYKSLFERAGFKDVSFYKNVYHQEDCILVTAKKIS